MDIVSGIAWILLAAAFFLLLRVLGWCIVDVVTNVPGLGAGPRIAWLAGLLSLFVIAAPAYVLVGPGKNRFASWMLVRW